MISAFAKTLAQLGDPAIRRILWISVGSTTVLFALLLGAVWLLLKKTVLFDVWLLEEFVDVLGATAAVALTWLLFPAIASTIVGLLLEGVARAVEARYYPGLEPARKIGPWETVATTTKLVAVMVALNILALPLYLFPVINLFVFYGLNGYLLGREYFELAALRRLAPQAGWVLRRAHGFRVFLAGVVIAFLLTVPVVNLLAPVIATAAMVHLVEGWRHRRPEVLEG